MATTTASVKTENASRYLQQLCKHWSHKFKVEFTPQSGGIEFGETTHVGLTASDSELDVVITADDASELPRVAEVVENHIVRFAFREELVFDWK
ncbi:DUF2218 domain-containing protein [Mesorhizobium sp. SB112]|uniref:DUF2218 domain-containing protein n=1 Tax=Mesorhizobium sp. SB112 TaxID=3151853 RepID=UPI003264E1FB